MTTPWPSHPGVDCAEGLEGLQTLLSQHSSNALAAHVAMTQAPASPTPLTCPGTPMLLGEYEAPEPVSETESGGNSSQTAQAVAPSNFERGSGQALDDSPKPLASRLRPRVYKSYSTPWSPDSSEPAATAWAGGSRAASGGEADTASTGLCHRGIATPGSNSPRRARHVAQNGPTPTRKRMACVSSPSKPAGPSVPPIPGKTAAEKATAARAMAQKAMADADKKAARASELIRIAQYVAELEAGKPVKRRRVGPAEAPRSAVASSARKGVRISVLWEEDRTYYKGQIQTYDPQLRKHLLRYDDDMEEWIDLRKERFRWLTPRATTAGCTPKLKEEMVNLGAEGLPSGPMFVTRPPRSGVAAPGDKAINWLIDLYAAAECRWYRAEILACRDDGYHHVLYQDGEDEWVDLAHEAVQWISPIVPGTLCAGLVPGEQMPAGPKAVGWRVSVYWVLAKEFHMGVVTRFDAKSGRHDVEYDGSDHAVEQLILVAEKIKWLYPTGDRARATVAAPTSPFVVPILEGPAAWGGAIPLGLPTRRPAWDSAIRHPGCADARVPPWGVSMFSKAPLHRADSRGVQTEVGTHQATWLRSFASAPVFGASATHGQLLGLGAHRSHPSNPVPALCTEEVKAEAEDEGLLTQEENEAFLADMTCLPYEMAAEMDILPQQPMVDFTRHFPDPEHLEAMPAVYGPLPLVDQGTCTRETTVDDILDSSDVLDVNGFSSDKDTALLTPVTTSLELGLHDAHYESGMLDVDLPCTQAVRSAPTDILVHTSSNAPFHPNTAVWDRPTHVAAPSDDRLGISRGNVSFSMDSAALEQAVEGLINGGSELQCLFDVPDVAEQQESSCLWAMA